MMGPGFKTAGPGYTGVGSLGEKLNGYNSYVPSEIFQDVNQNQSQRLIGTVHASWRPLPWMQNDGNVGVDYNNRTGIFLCRYLECPASGTLRLGATSSSTNNNRNFSAKVTSTSTWQASQWASVKTTLGSDYTNVENDGTSASGTNLPPGAQVVGAAAVTSASNTLWTATKTWGYYAQEQVALRDRTVPHGGGTRRPEQRIRHELPKGRVSEVQSVVDRHRRALLPENQRAGSASLSQRLRRVWSAAWRNGSSDHVCVHDGESAADRGDPDGYGHAGLRGSALGNPNLKPELSAEFEGGFEARVLNNRMNIDITYYSKQTRDALISQAIAPSAGPSSTTVLRNLGSVKNAGIEATIHATLVDNRMLGWDVMLSGSHGSNKLVSLGVDAAGLPNKTIGTGSLRDSVGLPINAYTYRAFHYTDANKDGYITTNEITVDQNISYTGYSSPRDIAAISNGFDLFDRKVRINSLFDYKGGGLLVNTNWRSSATTRRSRARTSRHSTRRWSGRRRRWR
jgi:outer membrane receptor protein involved in Fe transport